MKINLIEMPGGFSSIALAAQPEAVWQSTSLLAEPLTESLETLGSTRKAALELGVSQPTIVRKAAKYNIPLREK